MGDSWCIWEISVLSAQFCGETKTAIKKIKFINQKKGGGIN